MEIVQTPIASLKPYEKNAKKHPDKQVGLIAASIREFGFNQPIVVDKDGVIIVGHGRYFAASMLGLEEVPVLTVEISEEKARAYRIADNKLNESPWEMQLVIEELKGLAQEDLNLTGFTQLDIDKFEWKKMEQSSLQDDFIIPPFSIFDTRQDYWQKRRERWNGFFGDSREGRDDGLLGEGLQSLAQKIGSDNLTGTSQFDPVVAEICYKWFCPKGGKILDPFAGGVVRGAVAGTLGYEYTGVDLSANQIETNRAQIKQIAVPIKTPEYIHGDSKEVVQALTGPYDYVFSCPPYYDLEVYSEDKKDISNAGSYEAFIEAYRSIIKSAVERLAPNRFATFVVGDIRDPQGIYRGFVLDTIKAFTDAGMGLYNDIVLVNSLATAGVRARKQMQNRKVVKVHQNILAFYKGDPKEITNAYINLPKVERHHKSVVVFYKGDIEEIRNNYQVIHSGLDV